MEQNSQFTPAGSHPEGAAGESGRAITEPRFDDETIRRARPATPLSRLAGNKTGGRVVVAACLAAGIGAGMLGGSAAVKYYDKSAAPAGRAEGVETSESNEAATQPAPTQTPPTSAEGETPATLDAKSNNARPANEGDARGDGGVLPTTEGKNDPAKDGREAPAAPDAAGQKQATHDALRRALDGWVAATNARDLKKQMAFYGGKVDAFYLARNASRDTVRQEKERAFGRADRVAIRAGAPDIKLGPDGRTATMTFRKQYEIKRGRREQRGTVLQELRWRRGDDGWKIVSERDVRKLN